MILLIGEDRSPILVVLGDLLIENRSKTGFVELIVYNALRSTLYRLGYQIVGNGFLDGIRKLVYLLVLPRRFSACQRANVVFRPQPLELVVELGIREGMHALCDDPRIVGLERLLPELLELALLHAELFALGLGERFLFPVLRELALLGIDVSFGFRLRESGSVAGDLLGRCSGGFRLQCGEIGNLRSFRGCGLFDIACALRKLRPRTLQQTVLPESLPAAHAPFHALGAVMLEMPIGIIRSIGGHSDRDGRQLVR